VHFTLFLLRYPQVVIEYDGRKLDPSGLIANQSEVTLDDPAIDPNHEQPVVRILEWNEHGSKIKPSLLLCTADGNVLYEIEEHVPTLKDFPYTRVASNLYPVETGRDIETDVRGRATKRF
jgi:hypothetical protein